jgi:nicotinamide mononucleotide adenylyltransferase
MKFASVHGRFQPFHDGHLKYVLSAFERCDYLWIGITKCELSTDASSFRRARETPENNPLTFFERITIIGAALIDRGIDQTRFGFVPFPIEIPERLPYFMPTSIPCYTTVCDAWNEEKIQLLTKLGYTVSVLYRENPKQVSGSVIRKDIAEGGEVWKTMVPQATVREVEKLDLRNRLLRLQASENVRPASDSGAREFE